MTSHYDPMIAKIIVHGATRELATAAMIQVLRDTQISGPPTNLDYCRSILETDGEKWSAFIVTDFEDFKHGGIHTTYLDSFSYAPTAMEVLSAGLSTTIQDLPGRFAGLGIPRGGPADMLSFQVANLLVGNQRFTEALESTMFGPKLLFHTGAIIAVTGSPAKVTLDEQVVAMNATLRVLPGQIIHIGATVSHYEPSRLNVRQIESGLRTYLAVRGGFPNITTFMGSKATYTDARLGGCQGRPLLSGDLVELAPFEDATKLALSPQQLPRFASHWEIEMCPGPQWDLDILAPKGMETLLTANWTVTSASSRSGLRLDGPRIDWSRESGGEGGSHPSNIVDQGGFTVLASDSVLTTRLPIWCTQHQWRHPGVVWSRCSRSRRLRLRNGGL